MHRTFDTVVHALRHHAEHTPDATAIIVDGQATSYRGLYSHMCGFARLLMDKGLRRGQCVVMQAEQALPFIVAHYGTYLAGGIFVPLERGSSQQSISDMATKARAHMVISRAPVDAPQWLKTDTLLSECQKYEGVPQITIPGPDEPAELLFTTGTTGAPKGVLCSHRSLLGVAENLTHGMGYKENTLMLVPGQINHGNAIRKLSAAYLRGSAVMLVDGMGDMNAFFQALEHWPVTALCLPPAAIRMILVLSGDRLGRYKDQIDFVESGTSTLPEADKRRMCELLPHSRLYNSYGTSEAGSSCMYDYNNEPGLPYCIGRPALNARFVVLDDEGREMNSGKDRVGLIAYGGKMNMLGYWDDPELTGATLQGGLVHTNDMGYIVGGLVYVIGRRGDVINVGGNKVAPDEVEQAALTIPGIAECGCAGMPDPLSGQAVRLFVVMRPECSFDMAAIREALRAQLPDFKCPKRIEQRDSLPRSANGKLLRRELA